MKIFFKYQGPAFLWALLILILCSVSFGSVGHSHLFFPGFDKLVHCGFFFVLVIFSFYGLSRQQISAAMPYKAVLLIIAAAIIYGGVIELLQQVHPVPLIRFIEQIGPVFLCLEEFMHEPDLE